jgi:hypothetical protein
VEIVDGTDARPGKASRKSSHDAHAIDSRNGGGVEDESPRRIIGRGGATCKSTRKNEES